jgi:uncharacterized protein involved in exopolysaccharide biosynthesis
MKPTLFFRGALIAFTATFALGVWPLRADPASSGSEPSPLGRASMTLEVKPDPGQPSDATFLATQLQVIRKNEVLHQVIDRLDLAKKLQKPRELVAQELRNGLNVQPVRNTALLEVTLALPDKELAEQVLVTMALVYKEMRIRDVKAAIGRRLAELKDELENQQARVAAAHIKAATLRQKLNIIDPDPESANAIVEIQDRELLEEAVAANAAQSARVAQLSARCEGLAKLAPDELLEALPALKIEDSVIAHVQPRLADLEAEEAGLLAGGTLENDRQVAALRAKRDVYRRKIDQRREGILRGERTALKMEQDALAAIGHRLAEVRKNAVPEKNATQDYVEAKTEYLMAKSLAMLMEQRYAAERFDQALSVEPVKIWEVPGRGK